MRELLKNFINSENSVLNIHLCGMTYCDEKYKIDRKNSPVYCFEYIISGYGTVVCGKNKIIAEAGDVCFFKKGDDHKCYTDTMRPWTKLWFNVSGELVDSLVKLYKIENKCVFKGCRLFSLFDEFYKNVDSLRDKNSIVNENAVILHKIIQGMAESDLQIESENSTDAQKLREYIDTNYAKTISVEDLAALINKSQSQVIRIFKKVYGATPYEYALKRKMSVAQQMLKGTRMSIKEIAFELGFKNEHYFSSAFKAQTGITPIKYRKSQ